MWWLIECREFCWQEHDISKLHNYYGCGRKRLKITLQKARDALAAAVPRHCQFWGAQILFYSILAPHITTKLFQRLNLSEIRVREVECVCLVDINEVGIGIFLNRLSIR